MSTISIDRQKTQGLPKYKAIASALRQAIEENNIKPGEKLPPIRELAYQLKVTPATIVRAYQLGIDDGLLEARIGDGTYAKRHNNTQEQKRGEFTRASHKNVGFNFRTQGIPQIGQNELIAEIMRDILDQEGFQISDYITSKRRNQLAELACDFLNKEGIKCDSSDIILMRGASNAGSFAGNFISKSLSQFTYLTESACYSGFFDLERMGTGSALGIQADKEGILPEQFEEACRLKKSPIFMTSSIIQNPHSTTMSQDRMKVIAEIAQKHDVQIIDDIIHSHLITGEKVTLRNFAPERVWTITSLAKLGYPALRFGILLPPKDRVEEARAAYSANNLRPSELEYPIISRLLQSKNFYKLNESVRREVQVRQKIVRKIFADYQFQMAEGAPFFWLTLPQRLSSSRLVSDLAQRQILVATADTFSKERPTQTEIRITLGGPHTRKEFEDGLSQIEGVIRNARHDRID